MRPDIRNKFSHLRLHIRRPSHKRKTLRTHRSGGLRNSYPKA